MRSVTVLAPAKLNLTLDVTGTRPDGYHTLDMIMQAVSLRERVTLRRSRGLSLSLPGSRVPANEHNTAYKAALAFFHGTGLLAGAAITVEKHVPVRAGMAGVTVGTGAYLAAVSDGPVFDPLRRVNLNAAASPGQWVLEASRRKMLHLHFTMDDNLSLSERVKEKYREMYAGVFYLRYIKGLWAVAEGLIYTMFSDQNMYADADRPVALKSTAVKTITVDYGTTNPCVFLEVWDDGETLWVDREYRWDSRSEDARRSGNPQKTDSQYADDMEDFMGTDPESQCMVVVDPSAASFIAELRSRGVYVKPANNEVVDGIRVVGSLLGRRGIRINRDNCKGLIGEMRSYVWDDKAAERGEEKPVKQKDHGPDALRYYCYTVLPKWRIGA